MNVVGVIASAGGGGSVAVRWMFGVWFVQAHFGGCGEFIVGEWCDVVDGCVEPSASPGATRGVVDTHAPGVQSVGVGGRVEFSDK